MIWLDLWLLLFGIWPLADPGHDLSSPLSIIDIGLHFVGGWGVAAWVYRNRERTLADLWGRR